MGLNTYQISFPLSDNDIRALEVLPKGKRKELTRGLRQVMREYLKDNQYFRNGEIPFPNRPVIYLRPNETSINVRIPKGSKPSLQRLKRLEIATQKLVLSLAD